MPIRIPQIRTRQSLGEFDRIYFKTKFFSKMSLNLDHTDSLQPMFDHQQPIVFRMAMLMSYALLLLLFLVSTTSFAQKLTIFNLISSAEMPFFVDIIRCIAMNQYMNGNLLYSITRP